MEAKDQRGNLSPSRGRPWRRKHKGETLSPLSRWRRSAAGGTIAAVIVFINITIFISFQRSTLPHPAVVPYLNMVLYATYYDSMMWCHPMMF
jgi:hypothetical protein